MADRPSLKQRVYWEMDLSESSRERLSCDEWLFGESLINGVVGGDNQGVRSDGDMASFYFGGEYEQIGPS